MILGPSARYAADVCPRQNEEQRAQERLPLRALPRRTHWSTRHRSPTRSSRYPLIDILIYYYFPFLLFFKNILFIYYVFGVIIHFLAFSLLFYFLFPPLLSFTLISLLLFYLILFYFILFYFNLFYLIAVHYKELPTCINSGLACIYGNSYVSSVFLASHSDDSNRDLPMDTDQRDFVSSLIASST